MSYKVLVIDDDVLTVELLKLMLQKEGFEFLAENSGQAGIETARQAEPDVVIVDLMMPGIDGWQVCRAIRTFSQVPILVLSAIIDSERVVRALDAGANDYMVKPPPPGVVVSRIKKLIRQS